MKQGNYTEQQIIEAYQCGMYISHIEKKFHIDIRTIKKILQKNNINYIAKIARKHLINDNFFDVIDTEEKAYFLGFLFADGAVSKFGYNVRLTLKSEDVNIIKKLEQCIYQDLSKDHIVIRESKQLPGKYYASLDINSQHLVQSLNNLGCTPKKSLTLKFPNIGSNLHSHFLRGYFDGDGYLNLKERVFVLTSTLDFCKDALEILKQKTGKNLHIYKYKNIYRLTSHGRNQVVAILNYIYNNSTVYLDRKYELYQKLILKNQ